MNPFPIDAYAYANRLHAAHPAEKMLFAGLTIAITLAAGSPVVAAAALALVLVAVTRLAGIRLGAFWHFVRLPLGFLIAGVLTMAISVVTGEGAQGAGGALVSLPVGPWRVGVTPAGLAQAARVFCVSLACVAASLFLALTTPMADVAGQLRRWRVPALFVELMLLVYRFIFVLIETAQAMHLAQEARLGYTTPRRALRSVGTLVSFLFVRSIARAESLFTALTARGYTGELTVIYEEFAWSPRNLGLIALAAAALLAAASAARVGGLG